MQPDLRIAVICVGHLGNPSGVRFLARYFGTLPAVIFLHIDARADITPYARAGRFLPNVRVLPDRQPIFWGGFSAVHARLEIMQRLLRDESYTHFLYISEDALPVISASAFAKRLRLGEEFFLTSPAPASGKARYDGFFYLDSPATALREFLLTAREFRDVDIEAIRRLAALKARGKASVALHQGPAWFCLSRSHIETVIRSYASDTHLRESFEFSAVPGEHYMQTLLAPHGEFTSRLIFDDFTRHPKPFVFRDTAELAAIDTQSAPFVRKIALDEPSIFDWAHQFVC